MSGPRIAFPTRSTHVDRRGAGGNTMSGAKIALLLTGALLEFIGIVAIAFPDVIPYGQRLSRWQRALAGALVGRIRRLLRRSRWAALFAGTVYASLVVPPG